MGASPSLSQPSAKRFVKQPEKLKIVQHFWSHFMHFCLLVGQCSSNVCSVSRFCAHPHHSAPWKFVCRFIIAICLFQTGWVPCVALEEGSWTFLLWIQQAKEQRFFSCLKIDGFAACTLDTSSFLVLLVLGFHNLGGLKGRLHVCDWHLAWSWFRVLIACCSHELGKKEQWCVWKPDQQPSSSNAETTSCVMQELIMAGYFPKNGNARRWARLCLCANQQVITATVIHAKAATQAGYSTKYKNGALVSRSLCMVCASFG